MLELGLRLRTFFLPSADIFSTLPSSGLVLEEGLGAGSGMSLLCTLASVTLHSWLNSCFDDHTYLPGGGGQMTTCAPPQTSQTSSQPGCTWSRSSSAEAAARLASSGGPSGWSGWSGPPYNRYRAACRRAVPVCELTSSWCCMVKGHEANSRCMPGAEVTG